MARGLHVGIDLAISLIIILSSTLLSYHYNAKNLLRLKKPVRNFDNCKLLTHPFCYRFTLDALISLDFSPFHRLARSLHYFPASVARCRRVAKGMHMGDSLFGGYVIQFTIACCDSGERRAYDVVRDEQEALRVVRAFERHARIGDPGTGACFYRASRGVVKSLRRHMEEAAS